MKRFDEMEQSIKSLVDVTEAEREALLEDVRRIRALPRSERRFLLSGIRVRAADRRQGRGREIG